VPEDKKDHGMGWMRKLLRFRWGVFENVTRENSTELSLHLSRFPRYDADAVAAISAPFRGPLGYMSSGSLHQIFSLTRAAEECSCLLEFMCEIPTTLHTLAFL